MIKINDMIPSHDRGKQHFLISWFDKRRSHLKIIKTTIPSHDEINCWDSFSLRDWNGIPFRRMQTKGFPSHVFYISLDYPGNKFIETLQQWFARMDKLKSCKSREPMNNLVYVVFWGFRTFNQENSEILRTKTGIICMYMYVHTNSF